MLFVPTGTDSSLTAANPCAHRAHFAIRPFAPFFTDFVNVPACPNPKGLQQTANI